MIMSNKNNIQNNNQYNNHMIKLSYKNNIKIKDKIVNSYHIVEKIYIKD